MRILHLANEGIAGGVLKVAIKQVKHLRQQNHNSFLVTGFDIPKQKKFFGGKEFTFQKFAASPLLLPKYMGGVMREAVGMFGTISFMNFKPDWIICHNLTLMKDAINLSQKFDSKLAVVIHNPTYPPSIINYALRLVGINLERYLTKARKCLKQTDLVLAIHKYNVNLVRELYGLEAESILLACDPVSSIPSKRGDYILVPSRLSLGKKVHKIAEAISRADREVKVIFAGSSHPTTPKLLDLIQDSNLKNYTILTNVPQEKFERLFLKARMVIYGTSETDFMLPASYGAPVICSSVKYASDILEDKKHGYIIEREKGEELPIQRYVDQIEKLMEDKEKAYEMGKKAWSYCRKNHTWNQRAKELVAILRKN